MTPLQKAEKFKEKWERFKGYRMKPTEKAMIRIIFEEIEDLKQYD